MSAYCYDIIVVGAGHAGIEAAAAAARLGCRTALLSGNLDTVGKMSCNPAIGGLAKGQLAREVDALGGLMARATDACGIHFRTLGRSKGPAMWSPRAQCDKHAYVAWMKHAIEEYAGVWPIQGEAVGLIVDEHRRVSGVHLRDGRELTAGAVVLSTGTFLRGIMHQGPVQVAGGRMGEHAVTGLSDDLRRLGLTLQRLKTGTPPRVHRASIDLSCCEEQAGDDEPEAFSFADVSPPANRIVCWSCWTTAAAHAAILANLDRAPLYNGQIDSVGPRYCPSIEDKVVRFGDRERHHLFLEPEGVDTAEVYVNGLATSLPIDVQDAVLRATPALRDAHVLRYGYAIEYDMVRTEHLEHALSVRGVPGLYLAGQINGTSGYEEAAVQGLLAGANAARWVDGREPLILSRADAYAGVLVDDLVVCVPEEPYRMFTSRAEHRLVLRSDNADRRLVPLAAKIGLVDDDRAADVAAKSARIAAAVAATPAVVQRRIAGEALPRDAALALAPHLADLAPVEATGAWIELRYAGYLERQAAKIERLQRARDLILPATLDYQQVPALSAEGRRTLVDRRPSTLGAAERLAGVKQADVENLWAYLQVRSGG